MPIMDGGFSCAGKRVSSLNRRQSEEMNMLNSEEFLKRSVLKRAGVDAAAVEKLFASSSSQGKVSETIAREKLMSDADLASLLSDFARDEYAAGRKASAESVQFGMTLVRKGKATVHDVWSAIRAQEQGRVSGKERSLDFYISKTANLDPGMTIDLLKESGKDLLVCRDCGHREIVTGAEATGDFTCPECSGVLVPADKLPKEELKNAEKDAEADPLVGQVIGECKLEKKLGQGGMGYVYKAKHLALNKPVAIKFLADHILNETAKKRFLKEARAAAKLEHGNIVSVYNTGTDQGKHFIIMQFIEGESVGEKLKRMGPLPIGEAVRIGIESGKGIAAAHDVEMIHRDIKPDNIMVDKRGGVKVADFGLAKDLTDESGITISQQAMGTPHYMSPEQAEDARTADKRSDIYSFGATLYAILAGRAPFQGTTPWAIISQHQNAPVTDIRQLNTSVPEGLWLVIKKTMEKKKDDRYQDMNDVIRDLIAVYQQLGPALTQPTTGPRGQYSEMKTPATIVPDYSRTPTSSGLQQKTGVPTPVPGPAQTGYPGPGTSATIAPPAAGKGKLFIGLVVTLLVLVGAAAGIWFSGALNPQGGGGATDGGGGGGQTKSGDANQGGGDKGKPDKALEDSAEEVLNTILTDVDGLGGSGRFDEAMGKLARYPDKFKGTRAWDRAESKKAGILSSAAAAYAAKMEALKPEPEKCMETLDAARQIQGSIKVLGDMWEKSRTVPEFAALSGRIEARIREIGRLASELEWIRETRGKLAALDAAALSAARDRLDKDANGAVPGCESLAKDLLKDLDAELSRRANKEEEANLAKAVDNARKLAESGDAEAAIEALRPFLESRSESVKAAAEKAVAAIRDRTKKGTEETARAAFDKARDAAKEHVREGRFPEALAELDPYLKSNFDEIRKAAEDLLGRYRELKAKSAETLGKFGKAKELAQTGRWKDLGKAEKMLLDLLSEDPPEFVKKQISSTQAEVASSLKSMAVEFAKKGFRVVPEMKVNLGGEEAGDMNKPHEAVLKPYLIGFREVTNAEYQAFVKETGKKAPKGWKGGKMPLLIKDQPVAQVSADDAAEYCVWLAGKTGLKVRLPTPDEWEAAAGFDPEKGVMRRFPWGNEFRKDAAHLSGKASTNAGSFKDDCSALGILDMAGNVCEWTREAGGTYVVCGGCYEDAGDEKYARCMQRQSFPKDTEAASLGFRVAADLE